MIKFPSVEQANPDGLVAVSEEINVDYLMSAYTNGIFPWPFDNNVIPWVAPPERAVVILSDFKIPVSFKRELKKADFHFKINTQFEKVIKLCSQIKRKHEPGTWITEKMIDTYMDFNKTGHAVSFETYDSDDNLIGGLYGVLINKYFSGESMFHLVSGASKFALLRMVEYLKSKGFTWIDVQVISPLFRTFGAKLISRTEFMEMMRHAVTGS